MGAGIVGRVISIALTFAVLAVLAGEAAAWPGGNIAKKVTRTVENALDEGSKATAADVDAEEPAPGEAELRLEGTEDARFAGTCTIGDEEKEIDGRVPESFTFDLDGRRLECEIHKQGREGSLKVVFVAEGTRSVHRVGGGESTVNIVYKNGGVSSSTTSSSSAVSSNTTSRTSSSSSSSVVSSSTTISR